MAAFDEKCPFCGAEMDCRRHWDYETEYDRECRTCHKLVHISVHMVPEFETSKPVCQKCGKVEIQQGYYCPACKAELDALSEHNKQKAVKRTVHEGIMGVDEKLKRALADD